MIEGAFTMALQVSAPIYIARGRPLGVSLWGTALNGTIVLQRKLEENSGKYPQTDDAGWRTEQTKTDEAEITIEFSPGAWYHLKCTVYVAGPFNYMLR